MLFVVDEDVPNELRRYPRRGSEIPRWIKGKSWMDALARVSAIGHAASVPCRPSCETCCACDARGIGFEVVEPVCGVFANGATKDGEEH